MEVSIRPLTREDLPEADRIMRLAFGTFLGVPDPEKFGEGMDHVKTRWLADPTSALGAEVEGRLVGSNFAARLGRFGYFGPLTVHPDFWDRGVAKHLLEPTMELFTKWGVAHIALFTLAHSPKHLGLYQKFGFWPRSLTLLMSKTAETDNVSAEWLKFSSVPQSDQRTILSKCRTLTDTVCQGLDLEREIAPVQSQKLGDTLFLREADRVRAFAVCHCGIGTEAGRDICYVKFGVADSEDTFVRLLDAVEKLAVEKGLTDVLAGVNTACEHATKRMLARGFRADFQGVLMLRPNEPAFDRPENYVICDLR